MVAEDGADGASPAQREASAWAPWFMVRSHDKRPARLNLIEHLLASIPYKDRAAREGETARTPYSGPRSKTSIAAENRCRGSLKSARSVANDR